MSDKFSKVPVHPAHMFDACIAALVGMCLIGVPPTAKSVEDQRAAVAEGWSIVRFTCEEAIEDQTPMEAKRKMQVACAKEADDAFGIKGVK